MRVLLSRNNYDICGLWRQLVLVVALSFVHISAAAQNNPYKINDSLYPLYRKAYKYRTEKRGLMLADSLYNKAVRIDDKKAQCLALSINVLYYFFSGNYEPFLKAVKAMEDKALATGYKQYFYFGRTFRVDYLMRNDRSNEAIELATQFAKDARIKNDNYNMFYALNELGKVHRERSEISLAIDAFKDALEVGEKYVKDQDMGSIYRKLAECYGTLFDYQHMYEVSLKGYEASRTTQTRLRSLRNVMFAQLKMHNYAKVNHYYDLFVNINGGAPRTSDPDIIFAEVKVMKLIADGQLEAASLALDSFPQRFKGQQLRLNIELCYCAGDFDNMTKARNLYYTSRIHQHDSFRVRDALQLSAALRNNKIDFDNRKLLIDRQRALNERQHADIANANLELANTQLMLTNSSLKLQRTKSNAELMRISYSNKQLETEALKSKIATSHMHKKTVHLWDMVIVVSLILVIAAALLYLGFYRRITRRLRETHNQLAITHIQLKDARKRAEAADRMKTALLQNMNADINEPLNSVAGFAQLIVEANASTTAEERAEYYKQLSSSTAKMLEIVGNVLEDIQHV